MARAAQRAALRGFDGREKWQKLNECLTRKWVNDQTHLLPSLHHRANRVGDRMSVQGSKSHNDELRELYVT